MSPKLSIIGFGSHGHVWKSEKHENDGCSDFPKVTSKIYESKMKHNNPTDCLGHLSLKFTANVGPQISPDPTSTFFPDFPGISTGIQLFLSARMLGNFKFFGRAVRQGPSHKDPGNRKWVDAKGGFPETQGRVPGNTTSA